MRESEKVKSSDEGKRILKQAYKEAKLTQEELAKQANTSIDTVKRLLGTKECPNGVERWAVKNIVKVLNEKCVSIKAIDILNPQDFYIQQIPPEFERLIKDKTEFFSGRKFVFNAIKEFINNNPNGYFTVIGDAGMGKSSIAAKYVLDNPGTVCFFNIRAEGMNRPDLFIRKIREQLINIYQLTNVEDADLSTLLVEATKQLPSGENLVIVVDALDEVEQESTGNLLYLPTIIPDGVYFLLTRRPYHEADKRLSFSPSVAIKELDLRQKNQESIQDIKGYVWELLNNGKYKEGLNNWIERQNLSSKINFVEEIARKSENNFMYLRYILPAIAEGFYNNKSLEELPEGLQGYYYSHWGLMGMNSKPLPKEKIKIVYTICALRRPISCEEVVKLSGQDRLTVQDVINEWVEFLRKETRYQPPRYSFYHESFRDFLNRQDIVQAAGISLQSISAEVANNLAGEIVDNE